MSLADTQYLNIIENILDHGIYGQNRTGIATYKLPQQIMQFDYKRISDLTTNCGFQNSCERIVMDLANAVQ